jgi:hypothetical protein
MEHAGSVAWEYPRRLYSIITVEVKANRAPDMVDPAVLPTCIKQAFLSDGTDSIPYFWSLSMYCGSSRPGQIISYGCSCLVEPRREAALMTVTAPRIGSYSSKSSEPWHHFSYSHFDMLFVAVEETVVACFLHFMN